MVAAGDEAIDPSLFNYPFDPWRAFDTMIIDKLLHTCHLSLCFKLYYLMNYAMFEISFCNLVIQCMIFFTIMNID